jgi:hypothetical protein
VCILPEIFDNGLRAIKRFLAVRDPFFAVTGVQQFFECIVVFKALRAAVEFKFSVFPKVFQFRKILATEKARNDPDRKEELFSVVFPMVLESRPPPRTTAWICGWKFISLPQVWRIQMYPISAPRYLLSEASSRSVSDEA